MRVRSQVGGVIAAVGLRLVEPAAEKLLNEFFRKGRERPGQPAKCRRAHARNCWRSLLFIAVHCRSLPRPADANRRMLFSVAQR